MSDANENGIQAIIDLQALAGITESQEDAERGWNAMSEDEQEQTLMAYEMLCK